MKRINPVYLWSQSLTAKLCLTLCEPVDSSTPGFPVLHCLPEFAQIHVHWVDDAIQATHPLCPPTLSSCPQSFPASGAFPVSLPFTSGGQSIGSLSNGFLKSIKTDLHFKTIWVNCWQLLITIVNCCSKIFLKLFGTDWICSSMKVSRKLVWTLAMFHFARYGST